MKLPPPPKKKNIKPGLVASYDIRPGDGESQFWFWCFINLSLTYLLRHLPTDLQPRDPQTLEKGCSVQLLCRKKTCCFPPSPQKTLIYYAQDNNSIIHATTGARNYSADTAKAVPLFQVVRLSMSNVVPLFRPSK